jgi:hypothetical protein
VEALVFGFPRVEKEAPVKLSIELWPAKLKARATLAREGHPDRDVEVSSPIAAVLIQFLKPYLK